MAQAPVAPPPFGQRSSLAVLAGASGLVGGLCAARLVSGGLFASTLALVRRPLTNPPPGLKTASIDLTTLSATTPAAILSTAGATPPIGAALCAVGTTIKKAGSQAAFRAVDHDAVVAFATWAKAGGAPCFVVVSSVGADPRASTFYLRVKGEMEASLAALGFPRLVILRPSFLRGHRSDRRVGETIAGAFLPLVDPLLAASLRRYRSIDADTVAAAMVTAATTDAPGHFVWEHDEIVTAGAPGTSAGGPRT